MVAKRLQYHTWGAPKIVGVVSKREHPRKQKDDHTDWRRHAPQHSSLLSSLCVNGWAAVPKLFPYNPVMSRCQRWGIFASALVTATMWSAMFFNAECLVPEEFRRTHTHTHTHTPRRPFLPSFCIRVASVCRPPPKLYQPNWDVLFASLWALVLALPVPLIIRSLFGKKVHEEVKTREEKQFIVRHSLSHTPRESVVCGESLFGGRRGVYVFVLCCLAQLGYWKAREITAWVFMVLLNAWCVFFITAFILVSQSPTIHKQ